MRKALIFLVFTALTATGISICDAQELKLGVFDPQRISEETNEGKRVQKLLNDFRESKQAELTAMEQEIANLQNQLSTQGLSLSLDKKTNLEKQIQKKILDLNAARESASRELQLEIGAAQTRFQEQLLGVVEQFGRDEGFTLIIDANLVAWRAPGIDVTTALVDRFNAVVPVGGTAGE